MDLALADDKVYALEDFLTLDSGVQVLDFK